MNGELFNCISWSLRVEFRGHAKPSMKKIRIWIHQNESIGENQMKEREFMYKYIFSWSKMNQAFRQNILIQFVYIMIQLNWSKPTLTCITCFPTGTKNAYTTYTTTTAVNTSFSAHCFFNPSHLLFCGQGPWTNWMPFRPTAKRWQVVCVVRWLVVHFPSTKHMPNFWCSANICGLKSQGEITENMYNPWNWTLDTPK